MFGRKSRLIKLLSRHLDAWIDACRTAEDKCVGLEWQLEVAKRLAKSRFDASVCAHADLDTIMQYMAGLVPERETWLWKNRQALLLVLRGLEDAKAGRLTDGPDLATDAELIEDMEKNDPRAVDKRADAMFGNSKAGRKP